MNTNKKKSLSQPHLTSWLAKIKQKTFYFQKLGTKEWNQHSVDMMKKSAEKHIYEVYRKEGSLHWLIMKSIQFPQVLVWIKA